MLGLCKTKDAVSGSELSNAHIMTMMLTQCQTHRPYRLLIAKLMATDSCTCLVECRHCMVNRT